MSTHAKGPHPTVDHGHPASADSNTHLALGLGLVGPAIVLGIRPRLFLDALAGNLRAEGVVVCASDVSPDALIVAARTIAHDPPPIAVLDSALIADDPQMRFLARIRRTLRGNPILLLAEVVTPELVLATVANEVDGVVLSDASVAQLAAAMRQLADGHAVFPAGWLAGIHRAEYTSLFTRLSARQLQVLRLLAAGLSNKEIAASLSLSPNTVKFHLREIYGCLHVTNRVQAADLFQHVVTGRPACGPA